MRDDVPIEYVVINALSRNLKQSVVAVQRGDSVGFGHGWVIECRVDKVFQCIQWWRLLHDRLTDVDNFGRVGAKAMNA